MAEWLTHLTKGVGGSRFKSLWIPVINFPPLDVNICLGVFLPAIVKGLRTREQQGIHSFTVFIKLIYMHAGVQNFTNLDGFLYDKL